MKKLLFFVTLCIAHLMQGQLLVTSYPISANDLAFEPISNKLYLTLPSDYGTNGNSIGIFNYQNMSMEKTVFVGSEPTRMAVSNDGKYIYTAFSGSSTVRRLNLLTKTADIQFQLGNDPVNGPFYAYDLTVMPNNSETVAISRTTASTSQFYGTAIYDNGVARPVNTTSTLPNKSSYLIRFSKDSVIWGFNNQNSSKEFNKIRVNSSGCTDILNIGNFLSNSGITNFEIDNDKSTAYFDFGTVVDLSNGSPYVLGTFNGGNGRVAYDKNNDIVCYAVGNGSTTPVFKRYNPQTFLAMDNTVVGTSNEVVIKAVACKNGYYAFITTNNLYVLADIQLSAKNTELHSDLFVYQSGNDLYIQNSEITSVNITDLRGVVSVHESGSSNRINIANLSSGVYIINAKDVNGKSYNTKLIKRQAIN